MTRINWRERFIAFAIHLALTLTITGAAALLIFYVWFPLGLASVTGGMELFLLVVACDAALGPLVSLFIYNPAKGRNKLVFDYWVVGILQLAALAYGVYVVAESRPVYIAYDDRRIEIVSAIQLEKDSVVEAKEREYRSKPLTGPKFVFVQRPKDQNELADVVFNSVFGLGPALKPKYYRPYEEGRAAILEFSKPMQRLLEGSGPHETTIRDALRATGKSEESVRWHFATHRFGTAVVLIDAQSARPLKFVNVTPGWVKREPASQ